MANVDNLKDVIDSFMYHNNTSFVFFDRIDKLSYLYGLRSLNDADRILANQGNYFVYNDKGKNVRISDLTPASKEKLFDALPLMYRQIVDFEKVTGIELTVKDGHPFYDGNLDLSPRHSMRMEYLPDNLEVNGYLRLDNARLEKLPEHLVVHGDLCLNDSSIKTLPERLSVSGNLHLRGTGIDYFPESLNVEGNVVMDDHVFSLHGKNMVEDPFGEPAELSNGNDSPFRVTYGTWPGLSGISGDIHVELGSGHDAVMLNKLEKAAAVAGGTLHKVGDNYWADFHDRHSADNFVAIAKHVDTGMDKNVLQQEPSKVSESKVSIPLDDNDEYVKMLGQMVKFKEATGLDLLVVDGHPFFAGDLFLENSEIRSLPDNLEVDGFLNLSFSRIKELPSNLKLHGSLYLENTRIRSLPSTLTKVPGDLNLIDSAIETLPDNLEVEGWLGLQDSNIRKLPKNLLVGYYLNLNNTSIKELPRDLRVNNTIYFGDKEVRRSPSNISREGFIDLTKTDLPLEPESRNPRSLSPLMQQYADEKRYRPNVVPLFHVGDGYETYQDDARLVASLLGISLIRNEEQRDVNGNVAEAVSVPEGNLMKLLKAFHSGRVSYSVLEDVNRGKSIDASEEHNRSEVLVNDITQDQNERRSTGFRR